MNLPEAISIRPLTVPVQAEICIPGSKSLTNRALILGVLGHGRTQLQGALWAEDTELMMHALQKLGFQIEIAPDPSSPCNRYLTVTGLGGQIPKKEADLYVGTAGTAARFLTALCALGDGRYRIHGTDRMHRRPMKEVFEAIRKLGARVEATGDHLPAVISGRLRVGRVSVSDSDSSQFASALLLISKVSGIQVDSPPSPYVKMTQQLMKEWEKESSVRTIEPDASSASYFIALRRLHGRTKTHLHILRWPCQTSSQLDSRLDEDRFWKPLETFKPGDPLLRISRKNDLGDAVLTLITAAAGLGSPLSLVEAGNLRKQESDRISAMAAELAKCGVPVEELPEGLTLRPAQQFRKAVIQTYDDHRIAMSFAVLASVDAFENGNPWITIQNPSCVRKTFPNFFELLESVARQSYMAAGIDHPPTVLNSTTGKPVFA